MSDVDPDGWSWQTAAEAAEEADNYPSLYVDGVPATDTTEGMIEPTELERVQVEFDETANGVQTEAQEAGPLGWCNSAAIQLDRNDDSVTVTISVGDPRGAFAFTVRRLPQGNSVFKDGKPGLVMHLPYPGEGLPHMPLSPLHEGTYKVGS